MYYIPLFELFVLLLKYCSEGIFLFTFNNHKSSSLPYAYFMRV